MADFDDPMAELARLSEGFDELSRRVNGDVDRQMEVSLRLSCLHLAKDTEMTGSPPGKIIAVARGYADYVLAGKEQVETSQRKQNLAEEIAKFKADNPHLELKPDPERLLLDRPSFGDFLAQEREKNKFWSTILDGLHTGKKPGAEG